MKLKCTNKTCYMRDTEVDVAKDTTCLACGEKLHPTDPFGGLFESNFTSPFGTGPFS